MPSTHTQPLPTDACGTIEFQGEPYTSKAQYVRLAYDTRPELIMQLFIREWKLELPKLVITVQGGKDDFLLQSKLKKVLRKGLLRVAKSTEAWIFTDGTNKGVTKHVGDVLLPRYTQHSRRLISIGIAPWGIIENNQQLCGLDREVPYHSVPSLRSNYAVLNNHHAYFLLADNGTSGRYGAELILRRELEKYISTQKLHLGGNNNTPMVCLMIGGGPDTIRVILGYVMDIPPVPVVVCDGSGRAADLLAYTLNCEQTLMESMEDYLISIIQGTFEVDMEQAKCLCSELLQCTKKKNLFTTFRITDQPKEISQKLDQTILKVALKSQHLSPCEQLSHALAWNQVDIARSDIFIHGQEWPPGALEEAMMQALKLDRVDFVKLLLENGIIMRKFLSIPRLEELYNTTEGPSNTLGYILKDIRRHTPGRYTLHDIGLVINKLMGRAYKSHYTQRRFGLIYKEVMKKSPHVPGTRSYFNHCCGNTNMPLNSPSERYQIETAVFDYPFNELFIWAVLTKRQKMALLMLQHGAEALVKALVACKLYNAMAREAAEDDLETNIYEDLRNYGTEFENIALELLDFCYQKDHDQAAQLLTCELENWSGETCLNLAVAANHKALLAHPCSQIILGDLWMGGLCSSKCINLKVILGLLCPFYITTLEFKSKEELQLMPQTEEEHINLIEENKSTEGQHADIHCNVGTDAEIVNSQENYGMRNTVVQRNEDVTKHDDIKQNFRFPPNYFEVKYNQLLSPRKKLYEFYTAPITKFWAHAIGYLVFLYTFTYMLLTKIEMKPTWQGLYTIVCICAFACEKIRAIISSEPVNIRHKLLVWAWDIWNPCDAAAIIFFFIGLCLRFYQSSIRIGRLIFSVSSIYWYLRILKFMVVNKVLGPLITIIRKMLQSLKHVIVILLVVVVSCGVSTHAIQHPDEELSWSLVLDVFMTPYLMLFGEIPEESVSPVCGDDPHMKKCEAGVWVVVTEIGVFLLVASILLVNLIIANFNNIFNEIRAISHQVWMFQRFAVIKEYKQTPVLPAPLIVLCHIYLFLKYCYCKVRGIRELHDNALKLFLDCDGLERLRDFEEECMEGYFQKQERKFIFPNDECVRNIAKRVEKIYQKVEDIKQKESNPTLAIQGAKFRIRKLEDLANKTLSNLAVINQGMATNVHVP